MSPRPVQKARCVYCDRKPVRRLRSQSQNAPAMFCCIEHALNALFERYMDYSLCMRCGQWINTREDSGVGEPNEIICINCEDHLESDNLNPDYHGNV